MTNKYSCKNQLHTKIYRVKKEYGKKKQMLSTTLYLPMTTHKYNSNQRYLRSLPDFLHVWRESCLILFILFLCCRIYEQNIQWQSDLNYQRDETINKIHTQHKTLTHSPKLYNWSTSFQQRMGWVQWFRVCLCSYYLSKFGGK